MNPLHDLVQLESKLIWLTCYCRCQQIFRDNNAILDKSVYNFDTVVNKFESSNLSTTFSDQNQIIPRVKKLKLFLSWENLYLLTK